MDLLGEWDENIRTFHYIYFHLIILNICFLYYKVPVYYLASLVAHTVKSLPTMRETQVQSLGQEDPLEKEMATHSVLLPGKYHGQRSLVGCSPWGRKELSTTERLHFHFVYYLQWNKTHCNHSRKRCGHSQILFSRCFVHGISQARILEWAAISSSRWLLLFSRDRKSVV